MIRLLGMLFLIIVVVLAACSSGGDGGCKDIAGSLTTGGDGIPAVEGEVTTTASCLQIIDIEVGKGDVVQPGEIVSVQYTGYLEDGTIFDFVERGLPIAFALDRVIQGWQEGIKGMQVDGKRRLIIPPELAYGENPPSDSGIPPNATLIFDVELLEIAR